MATYVLRLWLPDRPGALGAVASRIGAVRGDMVGIDILERGAGQVIDELIVDLPSDDLVSLLVTEVSQVDGVEVEDVRRAAAGVLPDPRLDALETAALLVEQPTTTSLLDALADHAHHDFEADWAVVVDLDAPVPVAAKGTPPPPAWLRAFVAGSSSSAPVAAGSRGPDDVAWARLGSAGLALVLGRGGRPFRARERRQLIALVRIADHRWSEVAGRRAASTG